LDIVAGSLLPIAGREISAAADPDSSNGRQRQNVLRGFRQAFHSNNSISDLQN
jgi:hypothetical protein